MSNEIIKITLPDGTILEKPVWTTGMDIAEGISSGLAKQSILVELNGQLRDLSFPINEQKVTSAPADFKCFETTPAPPT